MVKKSLTYIFSYVNKSIIKLVILVNRKLLTFMLHKILLWISQLEIENAEKLLTFNRFLTLYFHV